MTAAWKNAPAGSLFIQYGDDEDGRRVFATIDLAVAHFHGALLNDALENEPVWLIDSDGKTRVAVFAWGCTTPSGIEPLLRDAGARDEHSLAIKALRLFEVYDALPADRGGANGAKGQARKAWLDAKDAALRAVPVSPEPLPDDWDLEVEVFGTYNAATISREHAEVLRKLWSAYCALEMRLNAGDSFKTSQAPWSDTKQAVWRLIWNRYGESSEQAVKATDLIFEIIEGAQEPKESDRK
ncbi:hypothetical protein KIKIMORA_00360 [Brevundimonas phage vB_BpoS-Kikimora]|uniref:Uncharacterized protein n=1 Tax=Brevundimonas phage vB_BpoS-Kikimora TaxID=2948601 RepID=A0A9E7MR97_9CAUD|nr:hypothetical protein KIKIMORA_00360 [Brevundimonas phage vB_BpoS-Kikimora]